MGHRAIAIFYMDDMETLTHFSSYDANVAARTCWHQGVTDEEIKNELLEQFKK